LNTKFRREDEGLFIGMKSSRTAIGKKWNIAASGTFVWLPAKGESNAENIDYRFDRAARHRGVCADRHEVSGFLGSRPRTEDAECQDIDRAGRVGIRAGTSEEIGEGPGPFGKRTGSSDNDRNGYEEEVLVLQSRGPASMPGRFAWGIHRSYLSTRVQHH